MTKRGDVDNGLTPAMEGQHRAETVAIGKDKRVRICPLAGQSSG